MANFFLIDHSLRKSGGHHFDYVSCVAQAANELGYLTTIGTNRGLQRSSRHDGENLERFGNVRRIFRETTYQPDSYLAGLQHLTRSDNFSLLKNDEPNRFNRLMKQIKRYKHNRRREQFVRRFAVDCERYFRPLFQVPGDHAFFTTVSELELMGLAIYLSRHAKTLHTHWHLQFHYNLFDGRTPEYEGQDEITQAVRACCLAALSRLSYHSVRFYATSETLVDQFNRLGVGKFELLPYPISHEFAPQESQTKILRFAGHDLARAIQSAESQSGQQIKSRIGFTGLTEKSDFGTGVEGEPEELSVVENAGFENDVSKKFRKPLRMTCPGEVRREKGHVEYLQPLVEQIWPTHLATGNVQVVVQRPSKKWHTTKQKIELSLPDEAVQMAHDDQDFTPIEYFSHPLSHEDYVELIKSTDCGLLFYDSRVYYSRRAGVLGELLSSGKPVIVPAGSWLAEQIQEPIFRHVDRFVNSSQKLRTIESPEFGWDSRNVPMPGGVLSFDQTNHPFEFSVERESNESAMVLEFDWHWPKAAGVYCRCEVLQKNAAGERVGRDSQVLGFRQSHQKVKAIFRMEATTKFVEFSLSNAFHHSTASIKRVKLQTFDPGINHSVADELPLGSVGVIASDREDLANCVDEIVRHFEHYQASALEFSKRWYARHDPRRTVEYLMLASEFDSSTNRRVA